jgi:glutamyl-tRNA synthetase
MWRPAFEGEDRPWLRTLIALLKPRAHRLGDFVIQARPLIADAVEYDEAAVAKYLASSGVGGHLAALRDALTALDEFSAPTIESSLRACAAARGVKAGALIHATRVAVTGRAVSPGLFEVLALLGRDRALGRMADAVGMAG